MKHGIAVKGLIKYKNNFLIVKRADNDVAHPSMWDLSGGRLDSGENPFDGFKREIKEETNIIVEIKNPLRIHHFTRAHGQIITMIVFFCEALSSEVTLDHENQDFKWVSLDEAKELLPDHFGKDLENYESFFQA